MRGSWQYCWPWLLLLCGCRTPCVVPQAPSPCTAPLLPTSVGTTPNPRIDPDLSQVSSVDVSTLELATPSESQKVGLSEHECLVHAAATSSLGNLIEQEGNTPTVEWTRHSRHCPTQACDRGKHEIRMFAAMEARNRSAAEALDRFFQLADAEGRRHHLAVGMQVFDKIRAEAANFRAAGLPIPDDDELLRQRSKLLLDGEQSDAGIQLLNLDLKARLGLNLKDESLLWPTSSFAVSSESIDSSAAVSVALSRRPDLLFLRSLYHNLTIDQLPIARAQLQMLNPLLGMTNPVAPPNSGFGFATRASNQSQESLDQAELAIRKQQLHDLILERERMAAAEVRTAISQLASAERRVSLARARVESWKSKLAKSTKPAEKLPAEVELHLALSEQIAAVMDWQRWRIRLTAAQGLLIEQALKK